MELTRLEPHFLPGNIAITFGRLSMNQPLWSFHADNLRKAFRCCLPSMLLMTLQKRVDKPVEKLVVWAVAFASTFAIFQCESALKRNYQCVRPLKHLPRGGEGGRDGVCCH